jgi:hypothetical protein
MQCDNPGQIARVCYQVAKSFSVERGDPPWEHVALLIGTSAVETAFLRGGAGPKRALGLWNIKYLDAKDVFEKQFTPGWRRMLFDGFTEAHIPWHLFSSSWLGVKMRRYKPTHRELRYLLQCDDRFACTMAFWMYLGSIDRLGENLTQIADHWYRYYPSDHNTRKASEFLDAWASLGCDGLMMGLGYA